MKRIPTIFLFLFVVLISAAALAQAAQPVPPSQDHLRAFMAEQRQQHVTPDAAISTMTVYGTLVYNFTIQLSTTIASGQPIFCEVDTNLMDNLTGREWGERGEAIATRSGNTASCTVKIPYQWTIASTSDMLSANYYVSANTGASTGMISRDASSNLPSIPVPASGAITSTGIVVRL